MSVISSIKNSGGDFSDLVTWESWAQGEFGTTPDEYIAEIYRDGGPITESARTTIAGWGTTTAINHPIIIRGSE